VAQVESKPRATSDPEARKRVLKRIESEGIEFLLLWFTDIEGHLKSFAITPAEIEDALNDGMGFDGSSITGFNAIEEGRARGLGQMPALLYQGKEARDVANFVAAVAGH